AALPGGGGGTSQGSAAAGRAPGGRAAAATATTAPAAAKAPIVVGMNCDCSGVIGAAESTARDSFQAWVQVVNAKGSIDGHPVRLLYADDNNSASQDLQNVKTFVEQN